MKPEAGSTLLRARLKQFVRGVLHHCCAPVYIKQVEEHPFAREVLKSVAKVLRGGVVTEVAALDVVPGTVCPF